MKGFKNVAVLGGTSNLAIHWMHYMQTSQGFSGYFHVNLRPESQRYDSQQWLMDQKNIIVHEKLPCVIYYDLFIIWADNFSHLDFKDIRAAKSILMTSVAAFDVSDDSEYAKKKRAHVEYSIPNIAFGFIIPDMIVPNAKLDPGMHWNTWSKLINGEELTEKFYVVTPMSSLFRIISDCIEGRENAFSTLVSTFCKLNRKSDFPQLLMGNSVAFTNRSTDIQAQLWHWNGITLQELSIAFEKAFEYSTQGQSIFCLTQHSNVKFFKSMKDAVYQFRFLVLKQYQTHGFDMQDRPDLKNFLDTGDYNRGRMLNLIKENMMSIGEFSIQIHVVH